MEDNVGDRTLKNLPQRRLDLIDGYISSYFSILNYPKRLDLINQTNQLAYVLGDINYERLGLK